MSGRAPNNRDLERVMHIREKQAAFSVVFATSLLSQTMKHMTIRDRRLFRRRVSVHFLQTLNSLLLQPPGRNDLSAPIKHHTQG